MRKLLLIFIFSFGILISFKVYEYTYSKASYYGGQHHGRKTASGEVFNMNANTAAHKKLPFGTKLEVTNTKNNQSVIVRVTDRGPFVKGRALDLSKGAFKQIASLKSGVISVKFRIIK